MKNGFECLLAKAGTGANAVCISSDGMFVLMHYVWGGQAPCNIQQAGEAVGEANTAWSQRCPHLRVCVRVCVSEFVCVRFVTAGWWIRTFRKHNWEAAHATASLYAIRIVTHTNTKLGTVGLHHTWRLGLHFGRKHTREHTHARAYCVDSCRLCIPLSPQVSETHTNTRRHTTDGSLYCPGITWQYFIYGSTVIWRERALQTNGNPHTNTHGPGLL